MNIRSERWSFTNRAGIELAGRLEQPVEGDPLAWAIFAHCFTCSKDVHAATRISRQLAERGFAILRFDFTGLGSSGGDFANTNFSSNVEDLIDAAAALRDAFAAPELLVGHSLGGAAVLAAALELDEVRAVSTIGAPSDVGHLEHLFAHEAQTIEREGSARVRLGGREFDITRQFIDDISQHRLEERLSRLRKAVLVFHSPRDEIVGIDHARRIYEAVRGPKSFVTLEDADHLLSRPEDSEYVASVLAAWARRYVAGGGVDLSATRARAALPDGEVRVEEHGAKYGQRVRVGRHELVADEPLPVGGGDRGPTPYDLLLASLGTCTSMTLRMYADRKKWPLEKVEVRLSHSKIHAEDCARCESDSGRIDRIERELVLSGPLDDAQRTRLAEIADRCPVHRTLEGEKEIVTRLAAR